MKHTGGEERQLVFQRGARAGAGYEPGKDRDQMRRVDRMGWAAMFVLLLTTLHVCPAVAERVFMKDWQPAKETMTKATTKQLARNKLSAGNIRRKGFLIASSLFAMGVLGQY